MCEGRVAPQRVVRIQPSPWWTLRSARTLARTASLATLRAGLLWAIATITLAPTQAIPTVLLATLLVPLRSRRGPGRRPLASITALAAALSAAGAVPALWTDGQLSGPLLREIGLWCLAGVPAVRLLDASLRRLRAVAARRGLGHQACLLAGDPKEAARVAQYFTRESPRERGRGSLSGTPALERRAVRVPSRPVVS